LEVKDLMKHLGIDLDLLTKTNQTPKKSENPEVNEESQPETEGVQNLKAESLKDNKKRQNNIGTNGQNNIDRNGHINIDQNDQNNYFQTDPHNLCQSSTEVSHTDSRRPEQSTKKLVPDRNADCLDGHNKDSVGLEKVSTDSEMDLRTD
jgi:hypothetical protein